MKSRLRTIIIRILFSYLPLLLQEHLYLGTQWQILINKVLWCFAFTQLCFWGWCFYSPDLSRPSSLKEGHFLWKKNKTMKLIALRHVCISLVHFVFRLIMLCFSFVICPIFSTYFLFSFPSPLTWNSSFLLFTHFMVLLTFIMAYFKFFYNLFVPYNQVFIFF
jgi:hypothetical protein